MKKQHKIVCLLLVMTAVLTGCTWDDFKAKFVGEEKVSGSGSAVSGAPIEIEDYDPNECVTLAEYKGVEVDCTVTKGEIYEDFAQQLQSNSKESKKIKKGVCKEGDLVSIDFEGKIDGKAFDSGSAQDQMIVIGNSHLVDGFDQGISGMSVGEEKDLPIKMPEDFRDADLAGKDTVFTVKLNYILVPKNLKSFMKKHFKDYKTIDEYEKAKEEELVKSKEEAAGNTAMQKVIEESKVNDIPPTLLEAEKLQINAMRTSELAQYGGLENYLNMTGQTQEDWDKQLQEAAKNSAKQRLVFEAMAEKEELEVTDAIVSDYISKVVSQTGMDLDTYKKQYDQVMGTSVAFEDYMKMAYMVDKLLVVVKDNAVIKK